MLKKTITYEDFNGDKRTEDFYFGYTKLQLMEMIEVDDVQRTLEKVQESTHGPTIYALFKKLIVDSYGVKSADGRSFVKNEELRQQFLGSPALEELIFGFLQDESGSKRAAEFFEACMPAEAIEAAKKAIAEGKTPEPTEAAQLVGASVPGVEQSAAPKDPKEMSHEELLEAYRQKTQQASS